MARPIKVGLDYFPLDTRFEDKVILLIAEFGAAGIGVLISLYQKIYSNGYYIDWSEDSLMLFSRYMNEKSSFVKKVIDRCLERNIFSLEKYEQYKILTSRGIQKQYLKICKEARRKEIVFFSEYLLLNDTELTNIITELISINAEESPGNTELTGEESVIKKQSKVKESKVKKSTSTRRCAEFVFMSETEYQKLVNMYGKDVTEEMIAILDNYKGATGRAYSSDYRAILSWVVARYNEDKKKQQRQRTSNEWEAPYHREG